MLLGQPVYNALFQAKQYTIATPPPSKLRFLKGQVVGKQLPPGEGKADKVKASMDPAICLHPEEEMIPRGNKLNKWWTCRKCLSRWERMDTVEVTATSGQVSHLDLMTFGKYTGDTFQSVAQNHREYCIWAQRTVEEDPRTSGGLQRFVRYLDELAMAHINEADDFHELVAASLYQDVLEPKDQDMGQ